MKFAPVCPIQIYEFLDSLGPDYIGNYFLLLAHDVVKNKDRYAKFFKGRDCTIIMDNSVIELGDACNAEVLAEAVDTVGAHVLAIPDVLCKGPETVRRADEFLSQWISLRKGMQGNPELMFIPQGESLHDFMYCLKEGLRLFGDIFTWIGIPRNTTGRIIPSRVQLTALVWASSYWNAFSRSGAPHKIHLLGFCDNVQDDFSTALVWKDYVEGIDSAVPLRLGSQGVHVESRYDFKDPGPRGDWWDEVSTIGRSYIHANVRCTREIIGEIQPFREHPTA